MIVVVACIASLRVGLLGVSQGHSLGGSLGTLLALMFVHRGVLSPEAIHPVFTFGAAAVFCEGASGCANCQDCSLASYCGFPVRMLHMSAEIDVVNVTAMGFGWVLPR